MYADDLVLLSSLVTELQEMVNICCEELRSIDLKLNESKSVCIRVGKRFNVACPPITTATGVIAWSTSATYLGVDIVSAKAFTCCISRIKSKFYASFNAIYGKLGKVNNAIVTLNLIAAMALPVILYASEALPLTKAIVKTREHPWSRVFMKIFGTFSEHIVRECQLYTGFKSVEHLSMLRKVKFMRSLKACPCWLMRSLYDVTAHSELQPIALIYGVDVAMLVNSSINTIETLFSAYSG